MSALFYFTVLIMLLSFIFGLLIGHSLTEQAFTQRSRRQAAVQRALNEQWRVLEVSREANRLFQETRQHTNGQFNRRPTPFTIND